MGLPMPFLIAFGLALVLTPAFGRMGLAVGLVDRPEDALKIHSRPVPVLGGVAVMASALGTLAALRSWLPSAVIVAAAIALGAGLLDDTKPVPPWLRLLLQAAAAGVLLGAGFSLGPLGVLSAISGLVLVLACANATNMLDGQDALVGGLAAIAALGLSALAAWSGGSEAARLGLALGGALVGFTIWNRPPARIFLGNGGAYAVGTLLAVIALVVTSQSGWRGLLAAGVCLGVFAFEIVFTVTRRFLSGSPIVPGDRFHSFDLLAAEQGRNRVTLLFWGLGLVAAGLAFLIRLLPLTAGVFVTAAASGLAGLAGARLYTRLVRSRKKAEAAMNEEMS